MKKFRILLPIIAVLIAAIMLFAACDNKGNSSTNENNECSHSYGQWTAERAASCTADGRQSRTCNDCGYVDVSVIPALGHSEVTDAAVAPTYSSEGLTEGKHCSACGEIIVAQQTVPMLEATYHAIVYQNLKGAQSPDVTSFAEQVGLLQLPTLEGVPGYKFVGWFTATEGGEKVDYIPKGSADDVILFARWELEEYTISYIDAPSHTNPLKYTIEDEIVLSAPVWDGLFFVDWTDGTEKTVEYQDSFGNTQTKIAQGTTGNIELRANWRLKENSVIATPDSDIIIIFDETAETFHFIYSLGRIEQVKIQSLQKIQKNLASQEHSWAISETVTLSKTLTDAVSYTVSGNVTSSAQWQNAVSWTKANSTTVSANVSKSWGAEVLGIKEATELSLGLSHTDSDSRTNTSTEGGAYNESTGTANSIYSSVSFVEGSSITVTETAKLMSEAPYGEYEYACVGTVHVFAVVTYDPAEKNFYLNTYSVLDASMTKAILYKPDSGVKANIVPNEKLDYYIPEEELLEKVQNSYYVRLNSNYPDTDDNGTVTVAYSVGKTHNLMGNSFEHYGFVFTGWSTTPNGGVEYSQSCAIKDLMPVGEMIDLYGVWAPAEYSLNWNDGTKSSITVKRTASPYKGAATGTIGKGTVVYYGDVLSIEYKAETGYYFANGGSGQTTITVTGNVTAQNIYANASPAQYTVKYNANGGTVSASQESATVTYGSAYGTLPTPTRSGYAFAGWYLGSTKINASSIVTQAREHTLTASWIVATATDGYYSRDIEIKEGSTGHVEYYTLLDRDALKQLGYNKIEITLTVHGFENWLFLNPWPIVKVYSPTGSVLYTVDNSNDAWYDHWTTKTYKFTLSIDALDSSGRLKIGYYAKNEIWHLGNAEVSVVAKK